MFFGLAMTGATFAHIHCAANTALHFVFGMCHGLAILVDGRVLQKTLSHFVCIEAETVKACGARLHLVERIPTLATSFIIEKIKRCV